MLQLDRSTLFPSIGLDTGIIVIRTVVPTPTSDLISTAPPLSWANLCTWPRPRPEPCPAGFVVKLESNDRDVRVGRGTQSLGTTMLWRLTLQRRRGKSPLAMESINDRYCRSLRGVTP
jgi:hypothetical protein